MNCPRRHLCWQSKRFYWERVLRWRAVGKGTQENSSATWLPVSGFMVMGLVSVLSLASHVVHALFSQDGCQRKGFWEVVGYVVSPFDLSWTLPVGGGLLVPCSLLGPPVLKQLMQMVTMVPGHGGRVSVSMLPLTITPALVHPIFGWKQTKVDIHICFVIIWRDEDIPPLIKIVKQNMVLQMIFQMVIQIACSLDPVNIHQ